MDNRRLGLVREALTAAGMDLTYAYEDLVFLEQTGFILQFTEKENELLVHRNLDADVDELEPAITVLQERATELGLVLKLGQRFCLSQNEDQEESLNLEFC